MDIQTRFLWDAGMLPRARPELGAFARARLEQKFRRAWRDNGLPPAAREEIWSVFLAWFFDEVPDEQAPTDAW